MLLRNSSPPFPKWSITRVCVTMATGSVGESHSITQIHISACVSPLFLLSAFSVSVNGKQIMSNMVLKLTIPGERQREISFWGLFSPQDSFVPTHNLPIPLHQAWKEKPQRGPQVELRTPCGICHLYLTLALDRFLTGRGMSLQAFTNYVTSGGVR